MSDLKYWVAFNQIPGIGRARFSLLEKCFPSMEQAWSASPSQLKAAGLDARTIDSILELRPRIVPDAEVERLERCRVQALTWNDPAFPRRLKEIYDVPPVLYVKGDITPDDEWAIAVVGTRHATMYGREATQQIVSQLVRNHITVVSGLARGIDSIAHRAALDAGGRTIAVFGCGLDVIYPAENARLAQEIAEHGALVSDYPLGARPKAQNFPLRNRIMSGMSLGVLVTESGASGGALITARFALEQNREVFAIPGSIFSVQSRGTNRLVQEGAKLVNDVSDILEELNLTMIPQQLELAPPPAPVDQIEALLLQQLSRQPTHIDQVCRQSRLPIATVSGTLALMELKGMVRQLGGMNYVLAQEMRTRS
ncbi:MAG: DNA-protecting protein DprA [Chloroflexi bacterium]|nr:DNA-protecting protein DprA [Chloroflexota bacterium]